MHRILILVVVLVSAGAACADDGGTTEDPPTTTTELGAALTDDRACGYGVAVGRDDQTQALFVYATGYSPGDEILPVELTDEAWTAELRTGRDLFANWCTDLITDPQAEVEDAIPVTGGSVEITEGDPDQECGEPIVVELSDVEVDGRVIGDFTVHSDGWGCFSG